MSSSLYTLMVLSASAVISRLSEWSNMQAKMPDSLSREPGCTAAWMRWKLYPVLQSHRWMVPLSALRGLKTGVSGAKVCTMKLCRLVMVTSWHQDAIRVYGERVDDSVVTRQVLDEVAIWEHPLLDVVSRTRGKSVSEEDTTALQILSASGLKSQSSIYQTKQELGGFFFFLITQHLDALLSVAELLILKWKRIAASGFHDQYF